MYDRSERRLFVIILMMVVLVFSSLTYLVFSVHSMKSSQDMQYNEVKGSIVELSSEFNTFQENQNEKIGKIESMLFDVKQEQSVKDAVLLDLVDQLESSISTLEDTNVARILELKQDLAQTTGTDLTGLIDEAVKTSVGIVTENGRGSGGVLSADGYIVTNNHLVGGTVTIKVTDYFGRASEAIVVVSDEIRDLAIIKVDLIFSDYFSLGNSEAIVAGEKVIAIGHPERLDFTVTQGIVSASKRVFFDKEGSFIQTDVPINKGSSGGPLVNMAGELIGINTFKIKDSESLGFSIPSNDIKVMLETI